MANNHFQKNYDQTSYELLQIADTLSTIVYSPNEYIIRERELGDVFYTIAEGKAIATKTMSQNAPTEEKQYHSSEDFGK